MCATVVDAAAWQVIGGAMDASAVIDLLAAAGLEAVRQDSSNVLQRIFVIEQKCDK